jgi:alkyl hydroperoxide reductase subunit AhpF
MGYPMGTVVEGIKTVSRGVSPLSMGIRKKLRQINRAVHIQVFVTPSDTNCPGVARLAHAFALDCHQITADVLEIQEYPALAKAYSVRSVPTTVINEHVRLAGTISEAQLLEKVLQVGVENTQKAKAGAC